MRVKVEINNLTNLQKELLDADLRHTQLLLMQELHQTVEKLKNNRGMRFKIVNLLSKISTIGKVTMEGFLSNLETLDKMNIGLFDYTLDRGEPCILIIDVNQVYFDLMNLNGIPVAGKILGKIFKGQDKFMEEIHKTIRNDYTKDFTMVEVWQGNS